MNILILAVIFYSTNLIWFLIFNIYYLVYIILSALNIFYTGTHRCMIKSFMWWSFIFENQSRKDELHVFQNFNGTKYADVELNRDHANQCVYTNDFIESQINGDDFDEWYSDVYPFCTGKWFPKCLFAYTEAMRTDHGRTTDWPRTSVRWPEKVFANGLSRNRYNSLNQPPFGDFIPQQCRNLTIGWIVFVLLLGLFITIVNVLVITVLSRDSFYHNTYGSGFYRLNYRDLSIRF